MRISRGVKLSASLFALGLPLVAATPVFAAPTGEISQVTSFIVTIVRALATIAGAVAAGYIVVGGYTYITSSGHPENLDKAKRTIFFACIGLVVVFAAFVIAQFVENQAKGSFGG